MTTTVSRTNTGDRTGEQGPTAYAWDGHGFVATPAPAPQEPSCQRCGFNVDAHAAANPSAVEAFRAYLNQLDGRTLAYVCP